MILIVAVGALLVVALLLLLNNVEGHAKKAHPAQVPICNEDEQDYAAEQITEEDDFAGVTVDAVSWTVVR